MIKEHVHSFRKVGGKLYCISPTCSRKLAPIEMHGRLIACPKCHSQFIMNVESYGPRTLQITCSNCDSTVPYTITLETQRELLNEIVMEELNQTLGDQRRILKERSEALLKKEADAQLVIDRYKEKEANLSYREFKLKEQRERLTRKFRDLKVQLHAKFAIEKQRLLLTPTGQTISADDAGEAMLRLLDKIHNGDPS